MKRLVLSLFFLDVFSYAQQPISEEYINDSLEKAANEIGVPVSLLSAICWAESNHKPDAYNHHDGATHNSAFGLCQVLYTTALELGMPEDTNCKRNFKKTVENPLKRTYQSCKLFGAHTNAYYAAKYLKKQLDRYDDSWISAIAAYNSGSVRVCKTGKVHTSSGKFLYTCVKGGLLNQKYVDRVLNKLGELE